MRLFHDGVDVIVPHSLYLADNILVDNEAATRDNWLGVGYDRKTIGACRTVCSSAGHNRAAAGSVRAGADRCRRNTSKTGRSG